MGDRHRQVSVPSGPISGIGPVLALHWSLSSSARLIEVPKLVGHTGHSCFRPAAGLSTTVHGIWPLATPSLGQLLPRGSLRPFTWPWCVIRLWPLPPPPCLSQESFPPGGGCSLTLLHEAPCFSSHLTLPRWRLMRRVSSRGSRHECRGTVTRQHPGCLVGVAAASPGPLAPAVPTLQAADMPSLPHPPPRTTCLLIVH